jgi:large subunit ribosomal protein L2
MNSKKVKVINNSTRNKIKIFKFLLSKTNKINKVNNKGFHSFQGRSSINGRITVRHKGGKVKRLFHVLNLNNENFKAIVITTMYDPNRSSFISLIFDFQKKNFYKILSTNFSLPGSLLICTSKKIDLKLGYRIPISNMPTGSIFHSLNLINRKSIQIARSAGAYCQLLQKTFDIAKIKIPSGKFIEISTNDSYGTLGIISNSINRTIRLGKAGINRLKGRRPTVRGIAMNPVDHPHGGRTNGGIHWKTPWGIPTKGKKTVKKKI